MDFFFSVEGYSVLKLLLLGGALLSGGVWAFFTFTLGAFCRFEAFLSVGLVLFCSACCVVSGSGGFLRRQLLLLMLQLP